MATLVADGIIRYSLVGNYMNQRVINVLDMFVESTGPGGPASRRGEADAVGQVILEAWVEHILPALSISYDFERVDYIDLNTADGATGSVTTGPITTLPERGGNPSADNSPSFLAMRVNKVGNTARGQRDGRLFLSGLLENMLDGNYFDEELVGNFQTAFDDFLPAITETGLVATLRYDLRVVHTLAGEFVDSTAVEQLQVAPLATTQVRRKAGRGV